jgi:hypothetical protein
LICLDRWTDNRLVEPNKRTRRLRFWFWVLVVAIAAWFWPGFSRESIHLIGDPAATKKPAN